MGYPLFLLYACRPFLPPLFSLFCVTLGPILIVGEFIKIYTLYIQSLLCMT